MTRPAESQRERAVALLKRAYADGRLELEEFEARAGRVLDARSVVQLRMELRGLFVDEVRVRARRAARLAGIVAMWVFLSLFLAIGAIVALVSTHASAWTLAFPIVWLVLTALAVRTARRVE